MKYLNQTISTHFPLMLSLGFTCSGIVLKSVAAAAAAALASRSPFSGNFGNRGGCLTGASCIMNGTLSQVSGSRSAVSNFSASWVPATVKLYLNKRNT